MKTPLFLLLLFISAIACRKDDMHDDEEERCLESKISYISNVDAPDSAKVNDLISIDLTFDIVNGCGKFEAFADSTIKDTTVVAAIVKYEGCMCTLLYGTQTLTYTFVADSAGTYAFNFRTGETGYIEKSIFVIN